MFSMSTIFMPFILLTACSHVLSTEWTSNFHCSYPNDRLTKYQKSLSSKCELFLIPAQDSHQNTDLFEKDSNLRLISGFAGHQGLALIFKNRSILWTNYKYELQAKRQLLCGWEVNVASDIYVHMSNWIIQNYGEGCRIKVSAWQLPHQKIMFLESKSFRVEPQFVDDNPNPQAPERNEIYVHNHEFSGLSWREKVKLIINFIHPRANTLLIDSLDDVAWVFNLRGSDFPFSPLFKSYAILTNQSINLFLVNPDDVSESVREYLELDNCLESPCITVKDYHLFIRELSNWKNPSRKWIIPQDINHAVYRYLTQEKIIQMPSPVSLLKLQKNSIEIEGMRMAHIYEGAALVKIMSRLEADLKDGQHSWSEHQVAEEMRKERKKQPNSKGECFSTVSAFGENGASMTYVPDNETSTTIYPKSLYFIHTGGQYKKGTTQVGRTFHFGAPTNEQIEIYTQLIKSLIDFMTFVFPHGTKDIDLPHKLAIGHLYRIGLDYKYEIGHGIGSFLKFYEKPISLGSEESRIGIPLNEGMFLSLEIGYFKKDAFGMLLTNTVMVKKKETSHGENFLTFEPVSMFPFEMKLIQPVLLERTHINWLNTYHAKVREQLILELTKNSLTEVNWLKSKTNKIEQDSENNCDDLIMNSIGIQTNNKRSSSKPISFNFIHNFILLVGFIVIQYYQR